MFFLISGTTGLVYEVLWAKYLSLILGSSAQAHTTVLATFMGGLALGNALIGSWADRIRNRLSLYGWLEVGIGFLGLLSPNLLFLFSDIYISLAKNFALNSTVFLILRLSFCMIIILLPTALMGGTLPTLSRFATASLGQVEATVSRLYFLNSFGAVLGALLAGFFLVPAFGLNLSITLAAATNIAIGIACIILGKREERKTEAEKETPPAEESYRETSVPFSHLQIRVIYVSVFLSGLVALAYEIAWIRLLSLVLGSSTYSFSLMLAAFIAGISLGSLLIARRILPRINSYLLFGLAEIGIALSIILTLPFYERLPFYFLSLSGLLNRTPATFYLYEAIKFLFCFCLMILPTTFLGMTLPLATKVVTESVARIGEKVGRVFSINTIGNVLGAVTTGLFLLPLLGIKTLIEAGIFVNLAVGAAVIWTASQWTSRLKAVVIATSFLIFLLHASLAPSWDKRILSSGVFRTRGSLKSLLTHKENPVLFYKDDSNCTVSVVKAKDGEIILKVNGKADASTTGDMPTQVLSAHIPLLLLPEAKEVLLIGLGSGVTAGSALRYPIERLDLVEISAGVVEAERFFRPFNHNPLEDERLHLYMEDAKTMLALTPRRYDIIISEPSNPWIAGIGNIYSVEFYRQARSRLKEGGIFIQWIHAYEMTDDTLRLVLRTFASVFENVTLWCPVGNDIFLVGSSFPPSPNFKYMRKKLSEKAVLKDLERIRVKTLPTILSLQVASDSTVRMMAGKGALNEDLFPVLEYEAPKAFFLGRASALIHPYDERRHPSKKEPLYLTRYLKARKRSLSKGEYRNLAEFYNKYGQPISRTILNEWIRRYPRDTEAAWNIIQAETAEGNMESALSRLRPLIKREPDNLDYLKLAANLEFDYYLKNRSCLNQISSGKVLAHLHRLVDLDVNGRAHYYKEMARVYAADKNYEIALNYFDTAAECAKKKGEGEPQPDSFWMSAARMALKTNNLKAAFAYANKALAYNPKSIEAKEILNRLSQIGNPAPGPSN